MYIACAFPCRVFAVGSYDYWKHDGLGCRKRPGPKSINARNAREPFCDGWEKDMPIPCRTIKIPPSVDIAVQLRNYYDIQLTSPRARWPTLFWPFDTMTRNLGAVISLRLRYSTLNIKDYKPKTYHSPTLQAVPLFLQPSDPRVVCRFCLATHDMYCHLI